jgi:hypothetical protein
MSLTMAVLVTSKAPLAKPPRHGATTKAVHTSHAELVRAATARRLSAAAVSPKLATSTGRLPV